jgi:hypothetical protein
VGTPVWEKPVQSVSHGGLKNNFKGGILFWLAWQLVLFWRLQLRWIRSARLLPEPSEKNPNDMPNFIVVCDSCETRKHTPW